METLQLTWAGEVGKKFGGAHHNAKHGQYVYNREGVFYICYRDGYLLKFCPRKGEDPEVFENINRSN